MSAPLALVLILMSVPAFAESSPHIKIGVSPNSPLAILNQKGKPSGLIIDVINDIAAQKNWQVTWIQDIWPNLLRKFDAGQIDMLSGVAFSEKRARRFDFTSEALISNWGIIYREPGVSINSILELEGKRLALPEKGIHTNAIRNLLKKFSVNYSEVVTGTFSEAMNLIDSGKADAAVVNRLFAILNAHKFRAVSTSINFNPVELHFVTHKGKNAEIRAAIDMYLMAGKKDVGSPYQQHLNRWLQTSVRKEVPSWVFWSIAGAMAVFLIAMLWWRYQSVIKLNRELKISITERKAAEEALRKAHDELEVRVENRTRALSEEIVERKEAQDKVKASLKEKEVLIREIHHRVKNNLQVVSSMLSLQARTETGDRSMDALKEAQRRVKVMARIHENLHQSDDLASINARDYLNTVLEDTITSSGHDSQAISCRLDADDIIFEVDHAVACGQIVSELLSNSLKHAFPNRQSGNIEVSLHRRDGGRMELTVADDGKGLPENFDLGRVETLGVRLVHALTMQLSGAVNFDGSVGTCVQVTFPENRS